MRAALAWHAPLSTTDLHLAPGCQKENKRGQETQATSCPLREASGMRKAALHTFHVQILEENVGFRWLQARIQ